MRSSPEEALSQLNKWKSESATLYVASTGLLTFWFVGRVSHASLAESHFCIESINPKDFLLSINLHHASFEFSDARFDEYHQFFSPQRAQIDFAAMLIVHLENGTRVAIAELNE
ncbi:MAG: hypothetical protein WBF06_10180 [Candidatus Acidiferrales bacterium]